MAQTNYTPISLYYSTTASQAPSAGNLVSGELAINITDGKLYYKDNGGVVQIIAGKGGAGVAAGSNTQVQFNNSGAFGASSNLTWDGTTFAASNVSTGGSVTLSGGTANGVLYLNGSKVATSGAALTFNGTSTFSINSVSAQSIISLVAPSSSYGAYTEYTNGTADHYIGANNSTGSLFGGVGGANGLGIVTYGALPIGFGINGSEQMRLTSTGLGIGTSSPAYKLDVNGTLGVSGNATLSGAANVIGGADASTTLIVKGATKGIRFGNQSTYSLIEGVDNTGTGSFQPLTVGGSTLYLSISGVTKATLDASGNLGLGVTPSAWWGNSKAIEVSSVASLSGGSNYMNLMTNAFLNGSLAYIYKTSSVATLYQQSSGGQHQWFTAPSGTAGNAITFTQAMTLDASGQLGIGTSSPAYKLQVYGTSSGTVANIGYNGDAGTGLYVNVNHASNLVQLYASGSANKSMVFYTGSSEVMRYDTSGNLGLGVTPSAWESARRVLQIGAQSAINYSSNNTQLTNNYYANSSGTATYIGSGYAQRYNQDSTGAHAWQIAASGTAGNAITFTQAMTLDANGNLGLGTTTLTNSGGYATFSVSGSTGGQIAFQTSGTSKQFIYSTSTDLNFYNSQTGNLIFFTTGSERARIDSSGNLLVGTTTSSATTGAGFKFNTSSNPRLSIVTGSSTTDTSISLYSTGAGAYRFFVDPNGTIYATVTTISGISDQRYKENIRDLDVGLDAIMALKPRKFDWKSGKGKDIKNDRGFIAQEFEQVFPDLIDEWKDPAPEGQAPYKSVRQDLIPVLVKAIQEQQSLITDLRTRVAQLEKGA